MATLIKIKRGAAASETAPSQLGAGELAVTYGDAAGQANGGDRLYIGNSPGNANLVIGGKYFADVIDHVHGTLTASSGLIADASKKLDNIKVDNLDLNGNEISTTNTNGDLDITPHGSGIVNFKGDGSSNVGALKIFCEQNTHGITIKSPAHSAAATYTLTLPVNDGDANNMLTTNGSGVLAWSAGVSGTTGTFSGAVSGTSGTFTAAVSGTTGTFTGVVDAEVGAHGANVTMGIDGTGELSTRTGNLTIDSQGGTVTIDDNLTISASKTIDMGANRITNIADPTAAQDAASKAYVDAVKTGLDIKDSCDVATTADDTGLTYANGTAGVGATLTNDGNEVYAVDGVNLTLNMRVLVKDQSPATENGIYYVSTAGAGGATLILTRALDANQPAELPGGSFTFVEQGTTQAENGYVFTHNGEPTFGSGNTDLTVAQFSGAGQVIAGAGLTKSGNTIDVVGSTTIRANADTLEVKSTNVAGQVLRSTGTANAAAVYGQLDLANSLAVTGIAAVANGGTGVNTIGANQLMIGDGANAVNLITVGTSGMVLVSAGAGTDPSFGHVDGGTF
jgi:hypothetical protein